MIDKKIFYCWFGKGEMSELNKRCIESWRRHCPDYEIIRVDESNFNYYDYEYSRISYEKGNWAFVSDVARIEILKKNSGFYLDTDVELLKSLDSLRDNNSIVHETGHGCYASGILGCERFPEIYKRAYEQMTIGKCFYTLLNDTAYEMYNLTGDSFHREDEVTFIGVEYFANPRTKITEKTIGIHWDENSWVDSWLGGFKQYSDFVPFLICNYYPNEKETKKWFNCVPKGNILTVSPKTKIDIDLIELGNYFKNPRVFRVSKEDFVFYRPREKERKRSNKKMLENGCLIEWEEE